MKRVHRFGAALLSAAVALAACGGGHGTSPIPSNGTSNNPGSTAGVPYTGPSQLADFSWGQPYLSKSQYLSPVTSGYLGMEVQVHMQNEQGLLQYAHDVSDPTSPEYRHFLSPQDIAARFGASASDYAKAAQYFSGFGMHVGGWPQRETLWIDGSIPQLQKAFGTSFGLYTRNGKTFVAPVGTPHFTQVTPVDGIVGLVHVTLAQRDMLRVGASQGVGYTEQQEQRGFDYSGAYSKDDGTGIHVAIIGTGPIAYNPAAKSDADLSTLATIEGLSKTAQIVMPPVTDAGVAQALGSEPLPPSGPSADVSPPPYSYSSGLQSPPPLTDPEAPACLSHDGLPNCNPEDGEAQLDTQTVATLAPGATVEFYLAYNPNDCYYTSPTGTPQDDQPCAAGQGTPVEGISLADAEIQQVIADDTADVVSMSYGLGEPFGDGSYYNSDGQGFGPVEFATMVSEGMAVFASSGDTGAFECSGIAALLGITQLETTPCASYPATDPSVVGVGGVNAPFNSAGVLMSQITAWGDMTTGGGDGSFGNNIGSGGGISAYFAAPAWQSQNAGIKSLTLGMRGSPDVSLDADPYTGPIAVIDSLFPDSRYEGGIGGTSLAAPQMAAMWALVVEACKNDANCSAKGSGTYSYRLGNPAPLLYSIYDNATQYAATFDDVLYGSNDALPPAGPPPSPGASPAPAPTLMPGAFQAGPGYDLVTGIGVPYAGHLINAVLKDECSSSNLP